MERNYPAASITEKGARALRGGHPWVFGDEVLSPSSPAEDGTLVDVFSQKGRWLGTGFYNERSKIRIRIISRNASDKFDADFWRRRLGYAVDHRLTVMGPQFDNCRLIFGEADQFPGLTVDRFGDILVTQTLSLGLDRLKPLLFPLLLQVLEERGVSVRAIYERNDVAIREKEGMEQYKGFFSTPGLSADLDGHTLITENGIIYDVDYINGQKTGFFLDQKYNRQAAARLARGRHVLDCFTHTGSFGLNAAAGGAAHVTSVDISADAIQLARANCARNALEDRMDFVVADVFDLLTRLVRERSREYDFIILDPPAFTKSSTTVKNAVRGYKEINLKAMKLLPRGGYLATCSCSHFMTEPLFRQMLHDAAADAAVSLRQVEARQQAPDHPILWGVPETSYLKFYLFQVV